MTTIYVPDMFFAPAKRDPVALAFGEKVGVRRQRLNRALNQPAMAAGISRPFFVAGRVWSGFVIADLARGYCASVERDGGVLLRNAIEETFGSAR
ncbi:hypothetical protein [Burkholderia lata]|uniref:hypothetical protein n=1 Tax=Burkholderia lata (strain ATCC 17760 / DSM 23089 / LMG 22485 / NCIMB 9086 / R18194 / 383) TaxID=482957 RepID=UPI003F689CD2